MNPRSARRSPLQICTPVEQTASLVVAKGSRQLRTPSRLKQVQFSFASQQELHLPPTMFRIFDPYASVLCLLVGGVGFGMTFFFNTNVAEWGAEEIVYPTMAMVSSGIRSHTIHTNSSLLLALWEAPADIAK